MSIIIPPGFATASYVLTGSVGTQPYVTTIGLDIGEAGGDFVQVADDAMSAYIANIMPITSNALTLQKVSLQIGQDGGSGSVESTLAPVNGARAGNYPPTAQSCIVRKITNTLGRRGRGRMFVPGIVDEAAVNQSGGIDPVSVAAINGRMEDFRAQLEGVLGPVTLAIPPVLLHSPSLSGAIPPTPIVGMAVSPLVGWVRGRIR